MCSDLSFHFLLSRDRVTIDGVWIGNRIYWNHTTRDYTSQITITHIPVFSVTLLGNGYQRLTFLSFRAHALAGWPPSHANLILSLQTLNYEQRFYMYMHLYPPASYCTGRGGKVARVRRYFYTCPLDYAK
jgi:hypothetical protein